MNNIFNNLINSLDQEFKNFNLDEDIKLSISKLDEYDLQINNLVKYNKSKFFKELQKNIIKAINESNIFQTVNNSDIGFINLKLNHEYLLDKITNTQGDFKNNKSYKIILDYGGPNIGKPLHVGHMRTLNIGRSLYNINSFIGNEVINDIHLGDWGMPIAQIITFLEKENINIKSLESDQLEIIYPKASEEYKINDEFKTRALEINKLLNNNDEDLLKIWKSIKNINKSLDKSSILLLTNSVLTYSDLITNRKTDYKFDLEKFTNVNGKTGIYIQYSQVRAKQLIENITNENKEFTKLVANDTDRKLLSKLFLFCYFLEQSYLLNEPHHLANYLYEISNLFNQFYENEKLSEITNANHLSSKLFIAKLFLTTSNNVMSCLGITPVNKM